MQITRTSAPRSSVQLEIELPPERLERALADAVRVLARRTRVPGFRPGKAPRPVLERHLGPGVVLDEAVDHLMRDAYRAALLQEDLLPLTNADVEVVQAEEGKPFIFKAIVSVRPDVTLGDVKGFPFAPEIVAIDDARVDQVIDELRDQNATLAAVEDRGARDGDYVVISFVGTRDGEPFEGGTSERMPLILGQERLIPGFEANLLGKRVGESVEFDIETLSPTYHLRIGLPGTSQAFNIASRLGLPDALVAEARSRLGRAQAEFEQTLVSIKETQQTAEEALARAADAEQRARTARHEAEEERRSARRERAAAAEEARAEAQRALAQVQAEIGAARELLARASLTEAGLEESAARLDQQITALTDEAAAAEPVEPAPPPIPIGATVRSRDGWRGTVAEIDIAAGTAEIAAGTMRIKVPLDDLEVVPTKAELPGETIRPQPHQMIPSSLDLRGARVDEAMEALDRYIDTASVAGAPRVTVVHGHGTGALRDALRAQLSGNPLVKKWRAGERGEGGDGATIVEL